MLVKQHISLWTSTAYAVYKYWLWYQMTACWPEMNRSFLVSCCHFSWHCFSFWLFTDLWGKLIAILNRGSTTESNSISQKVPGVTTRLTLSDPRIHRRQKEGGTYSPREAEIIETKFKLDQLIAVADLELKEDKINRWGMLYTVHELWALVTCS